jgi:hypothetical protein
LTISSIALGQQRVAEPGRADAEQAVQDEVDLAQVLVEQALEDQDADEARHRVGQEEHQAVGALEGQRFPVQQHRQQQAQGRGQQHRQRREDHGPDEDADEGLAKAPFAEDLRVVRQAHVDAVAGLQAVAFGAGVEAGRGRRGGSVVLVT